MAPCEALSKIIGIGISNLEKRWRDLGKVKEDDIESRHIYI